MFGFSPLSPSQIAAAGGSVGTPTWWKSVAMSTDGRTLTFDNGDVVAVPAVGGTTGTGDSHGGAVIKNIDSTIYVDGQRITAGQMLQGSSAGYTQSGGDISKGHTATQAELDAMAAQHESPDTQEYIVATPPAPGMSTGAKVAIGAGALGIAALAFKKMKKRKT